jgi:plasmid replication initiation protein
MQVDMSILSFDEIQEVMNVMSSFDNIFRDSSERERSLFLEMTIKRTLEKSAVQKTKDILKSELSYEAIIPPIYDELSAPSHSIVTARLPIQEIVPIKSQTATRIYGEQWIVIQNRLLNAISHLELNERRLIMFLSPIVRKAIDSNPKQRVFKAYVIDFMEQYAIKSKKYYGEFAKIADSILEKVFYFWEDYKNTKVKVGANWVSECRYLENEGALEIRLDDRVIEMLTIFDRNNPFTKYERQMIVNLGTYGIILFELIASCMHQQHKQKAYTIEYLREKFNCVATYPEFFNFKRYVIDRAIADIHQHTPFRIKYTQNKKGRIVSELVFTFEDIAVKTIKTKKKKGETERDPNTIDWVNGATDNEIKLLSQKQADYFASKLANNTNFGSKFAKIGEDSKPFISRISKELQRDISKVSSYMPYLISEGYSPTN